MPHDSCWNRILETTFQNEHSFIQWCDCEMYVFCLLLVVRMYTTGRRKCWAVRMYTTGRRKCWAVRMYTTGRRKCWAVRMYTTGRGNWSSAYTHHLGGIVVRCLPWECQIKDSSNTVPGQVISLTDIKVGNWWQPCQMPGATGSVLGRVGRLSVYCDCMRLQVGDTAECELVCWLLKVLATG